MSKHALALVMGYKTKCPLCGDVMKALTRDSCSDKLTKHIDNKCKAAKLLKVYDKAGLLNDLLVFNQGRVLGDKLKKILKDFSIDEIRDELDLLEQVGVPPLQGE